MHYPLLVILGRLGMTGIAQLFNLLLKKALVPRHMGAVAGPALPGGSGLMLYPLLKSGAIMARKTVDGSRGCALGPRKEEEDRGQEQYEL
jgi:hypothetical protein